MSVTSPPPSGSKILPLGRRLELEYYEFGSEARDAHPVLFHYGLPGSGYLAALAHGVAKQLGMRIIAPNRPGTGSSTYDPTRKLTDWPRLITRLADVLRIDRATVIGVSSGGAYACAFACLCPERVSGIVLLSSLAPVEKPGLTRGMRLLNRLFCILGRRFPPLTRLPLHVLAARYRRDPSGFQRRLARTLPAHDRAVLTHPEVAAPFDRAMEETFRQGAQGLAHDINIVTGPWVDLAKTPSPPIPLSLPTTTDDRIAKTVVARRLQSG